MILYVYASLSQSFQNSKFHDMRVAGLLIDLFLLSFDKPKCVIAHVNVFVTSDNRAYAYMKYSPSMESF